MQKTKNLCLDRLLQRRGQDVEMYVKALREMEEEVRESYEEEVTMDKDDFVEMLLLDGCFIEELISRRDDYFCYPSVERNMSGIMRDMLLFENQLPFTVIEKLFSLSEDSEEKREIVPLVLKFFKHGVAGTHIKVEQGREDFNPGSRFSHLLGIVYRHLNLLPLKKTVIDIAESMPGLRREWETPSAIQLKEAGIEFRRSLSPLRFEDGKLRMPRLIICEEYESMLRNLIAYEQLLEYIPHQVTKFSMVMQHLITVPEDVKLLRRDEIVPIGRGHYDSDEQIVHFFQTLVQSVELKWHNVAHLYILDDAMKYGSGRIKWKVKCNRWMQKLWDDYFSSPWALISFIAAVILLVLTFLQTFYSIISYKK